MSGSPKDPQVPGEAPPLDDVAARVSSLIERGLRRYGKGDLDGALGEWELALALDPDAKAAEEYIAYVRENFEVLSESFRAEREAVEKARAEGIPVPEDDPNEDDFPEIELSETPPSGPKDGAGDLADGVTNGPAAVSPTMKLSHEISSVDEGWDLGDVGDVASRMVTEASPPPGGMPVVTVLPRGFTEAPLEEALLAGGATADDFEYSDLPDPGAAERAAAAATQPDPPFQTEDEGLGIGEIPTVARASQSQPIMPPPLDEDYSLEFQDEFSRQATRGALEPDDATTAPGPPSRALPDTATPGGPPPPLDYDDVVEFVQPGTGERRRPTVRPRPAPEDSGAKTVPNAGAPPRPPHLAKVFDHVRDCAERSDFSGAVQGLESFFDEDPDLIFLDAREKEMLMRIYEAYLGRMDQIPLVAVPMHEISAAHLDHRTGFLLSRIDGMLTFEDILDVAGMPRLEAYRILSKLLSRGFLEVR